MIDRTAARHCVKCGKLHTRVINGYVNSYCRDCHKKRCAELGQRAKDVALAAYSDGNPKCVCCGESERSFLCLDHPNRDGVEQRQRLGCGSQFYRALKKQGFPPGLRVLCANCNMATRYGRECPHKGG